MNIRLDDLKTSLVAQLDRNNVVANNLANANTAGFKREVAFAEYLEAKGQRTAGIRVETDYSQGSIHETGNPLDLALSGSGFFSIETAAGTAYTRDGHFSQDPEGYLITAAGQHVLGAGGWIQLTDGRNQAGDVRIGTAGEVIVNDEYQDRLKIVDFTHPEDLKKLGGNLLAGNPGHAETVEFPRVLQGQIEASNVQAVDEMISLIELQRQFESTQKAIRSLDEALGRAAGEVGRYR